MPPRRKPDQTAPKPTSPTGTPTGRQQIRPARPIREVPDHRAGPAAARHRPLAQSRRPRSVTSRGLPPAGEDHALRPRAHPRARRARPWRRRARGVRVLRHRRVGHQGRLPGPRRARRRRSSAGSRPFSARAGPPTRCATPEDSRSSSTPTRATSTWSATTSRCSSSRTASSSPTSSTPASPIPTGRSRRRSRHTTRSGTSCRCTPRPPITCSGT